MPHKIYNIDCLEYMSKCRDHEFDLAIVDPPYMANIDEYLGMQKRLNNGKAQNTDYKDTQTFGKPSKKYFKELFRVSKKQIIWGINHFKNFGPGRIIWDKNNSGQFNDCEIAYQNISKSIRIYKCTWNGMLQYNMKDKETRIHPTQKPIQLYKWLLMNYAKPGQKVLDTHLGSGSIIIAAEELGFDIVGCEINKDYYNAAVKRINLKIAQKKLML